MRAPYPWAMSSAADIADLARSCTTVLVVSGSVYDAHRRRSNDVLASVSDRESIVEVVDALAAEPTDHAWMTPGGPSLVFLADREVLLVATWLPPDHVRCPQLWSLDAQLARPDRLERWLLTHGVGPADPK